MASSLRSYALLRFRSLRTRARLAPAMVPAMAQRLRSRSLRSHRVSEYALGEAAMDRPRRRASGQHRIRQLRLECARAEICLPRLGHRRMDPGGRRPGAGQHGKRLARHALHQSVEAGTQRARRSPNSGTRPSRPERCSTRFATPATMWSTASFIVTQPGASKDISRGQPGRTPRDRPNSEPWRWRRATLMIFVLPLRIASSWLTT